MERIELSLETLELEKEPVLVGYKGNRIWDYETVSINCPYIPVTLTPVPSIEHIKFDDFWSNDLVSMETKLEMLGIDKSFLSSDIAPFSMTSFTKELQEGLPEDDPNTVEITQHVTFPSTSSLTCSWEVIISPLSGDFTIKTNLT